MLQGNWGLVGALALVVLVIGAAIWFAVTDKGQK